MAQLNYLQINQHPIFARVRVGLPKDIPNSRSVLAIRDDMLFAWNFQDSCILALNIKTVRHHGDAEIMYQTLMPISPPLFNPDRLIVNESNTLLAAYGANVVLVFKLPQLTPPYGTFNNNKEVIFTRTHSLHERVLAFSSLVEVRQVRFHPGSLHDNHVCFLTNDNMFHVFAIRDGTALQHGVYHVGPSITCNVPSSTISIQEALGETAVDFDFGPPEVAAQPKSLTKKDLSWPIYFLTGDASIYIVTVNLSERIHPEIYGPHTIVPLPDGRMSRDYCSLAVIHTVPPLLVIVNCNGNLFHVLALDSYSLEVGTELKVLDDQRNDAVDRSLSAFQRPGRKHLLLLETIELELGFDIGNYPPGEEYSCPIHLYKDEGLLGRYYATHEAGVHGIEIGCIAALSRFADEKDESVEDEDIREIVSNASTMKYLVCTKTNLDAANPVIGFALYYNPYSYIALLADGEIINLAIIESIRVPTDVSEVDTPGSPLKKMLSGQFEAHIQNILKQNASMPVIQRKANGEATQQECYDFLQAVESVLRTKCEKHEKAREEIEKRVKALRMIKEYQKKELEKIREEKVHLQENAMKIAEKYEELKDSQEVLIKRCQKLLVGISKQQDIPSYAEEEYNRKLQAFGTKVEFFREGISKLRSRIAYTDNKIQTHSDQTLKSRELSYEQSKSFKGSLDEATKKINEMMKNVNELKIQLNID